MTDAHRRSLDSLVGALAASLEAAESTGDPVDRLLALSETAERAAAVVREVDVAISRAVRQALTTMTLDDLSHRLHQRPGNDVFLLSSFLTPAPQVDDGGPCPEGPDASSTPV